jgi:hypothetical protein
MKAEVAGDRDRKLPSRRRLARNRSERFAPNAPSAYVGNSLKAAFWRRIVGSLAFPSAGGDKGGRSERSRDRP